MEYNEDGSPKRDFPVTLVKGDEAVRAFSEADVVNAEWRGFVVKGEGEKALAAAQKATEKAEKDANK